MDEFNIEPEFTRSAESFVQVHTVVSSARLNDNAGWLYNCALDDPDTVQAVNLDMHEYIRARNKLVI
jgi:hypothetical protein